MTSFKWLTAISWLIWFRISSSLAGLAGRVLVIAWTSRRGTPLYSSAGSTQQTLERASAMTFVLPLIYTWYRDLGMMLISAPASILHKARVCFPSRLNARQTSKRAFSLQETTWTLLAKGVVLIGPRNMWSQDD